MEIPHTDFKAVFSRRRALNSILGEHALRTLKAGTLIAPSGRIVACDPSWLSLKNARKPLGLKVCPGRYPVSICVCTPVGKRTDVAVACARLQFSRGMPSHWEMATHRGEDVRKLKPGQYFGYSVDSGLACFADVEALAGLSEPQLERMFFDDLLPALEESKLRHLCAELTLDKDSGANLIAFSTGYGDGAYPCFWGYDKAERVVTLETDFQVLL